MKAPFEVGWSEFSSMRLWRFSESVLKQHTPPKFSEIGGSDGTRTRGLLRDRRSNQLSYASALKTDSLQLPRIPPAAHRFLKLPENAVTGQRSSMTHSAS